MGEKSKHLFEDLSYELNGIAFKAAKEIGRFGREKQYGDLFENKLKEGNIKYKRELKIGDSGNQCDYIIEGKVLVELKAQPFVTKEDYYQVQRYLYALNYELGIIYNFRDTYIKPKRILRPKEALP